MILSCSHILEDSLRFHANTRPHPSRLFCPQKVGSLWSMSSYNRLESYCTTESSCQDRADIHLRQRK